MKKSPSKIEWDRIPTDPVKSKKVSCDSSRFTILRFLSGSVKRESCGSDFLDKESNEVHRITLPETNIAPEKWWLEDYFPIGKVTFQGLC